MSDLEAGLASVRGELEALDRRREELDRQRAALERQHEELSAAVRVMDRLSSRTARPSPTDDSATELPLTPRVLNAIVDAGVATRPDLLRRFVPEVNPNTLDSAVLAFGQTGFDSTGRPSARPCSPVCGAGFGRCGFGRCAE